MTFEQIRYFLAIVNKRTFTAAAEDLYISQSSLSKTIKALEHELDCILFVRGNKYVELTDAGQIFYYYAKRAEHNRVTMLNEISMLNQNSKRKEVSLGILPVIDELDILDHITEFQNRLLYSHTYVNLVEGDQDELVRRLGERKLDAAIVRADELDPDLYNSVTLMKNELVVVCNRSHDALGELEEVELSQLVGFPFIEFDTSSYLSRKIRSAFDVRNILPNYAYSYKRHQQILSMINAGYGITIMPSDLINTSRFGNVHIIHLKQPIFTNTSLIWLKDAPKNDIISLLAAFFAEIDMGK